MVEILLEGYTPREILSMPDVTIDNWILCNEPLAFRAGSAMVLGQFRIRDHRLVVELAQIDGGGEGILTTLWSLATRLAERRNLTHVDWIVHAVACARPNLKLRRVLERRGFQVEDVPGRGRAYRLTVPVLKD